MTFPNPTAQVLVMTPHAHLVEHAPSSTMIDISGLTSSAAGLLKQLLASMAVKEDTNEEVQKVESAKHTNKMV
jgi:hypothetical protein